MACPCLQDNSCSERICVDRHLPGVLPRYFPMHVKKKHQEWWRKFFWLCFIGKYLKCLREFIGGLGQPILHTVFLRVIPASKWHASMEVQGLWMPTVRAVALTDLVCLLSLSFPVMRKREKSYSLSVLSVSMKPGKFSYFPYGDWQLCHLFHHSGVSYLDHDLVQQD